ncbi:PaaX family transcriptional regulator C-terminal domain-containing protein [uncultured Agrobacterium sp.]|uniref:PaaX family transcriptional regulator C-terminal domain-containing protein n=1 Tax=uncultured Agrobacterium sp. TaxID=157277 RepID=UPI00258DB477|nr:PaaX family transcriptional regulator C-terminal domain-containing protein [uncultured Agrobacterium sp.]
MSLSLQNDTAEVASGELISTLLDGNPLKAAGFIVTIYGDVIEPRGGVVWMGNLIETCAMVGISETLVRTAVSRLVAAEQLVGEREGRRSFYRLTKLARTEFAIAARLLFGPPEEVSWHFVQPSGDDADEAMFVLERAGYARLGPRLAVGPRAAPAMKPSAVVFQAELAGGEAGLRAFVADHWNLTPHADAYRGFLTRFGLISNYIERGGSLSTSQSLIARLLLVHQFRMVMLRDPRLPEAGLPEDWPGGQARLLFARLYCQLSPKADLHVADQFISVDGALEEANAATRARLTSIAHVLG